MLLKVSDGAGGWTLLDKVDQVRHTILKKPISSLDEIKELQGEISFNFISKTCFTKNEPISVGVIEIQRDNKVDKGLFTDVVFVLSDAGDTLDRLSAKNKLRR